MNVPTNAHLLSSSPMLAPLDVMLHGVAKVFMTGRSQAIRLPKEFRFNSKEVTIEKHGDAIVLRPKVTKSKEEWWAEMDEILDGFEGMELIERDHSGLTAPVNFGA